MRNTVRLVIAMVLVVAATLPFTASAQAQTPEFITDCDPDADLCTETTVTGGHMTIRDTTIDLPAGSQVLRMGLGNADPGDPTGAVPIFEPPSGDSMLQSEPVDTGILGIDARLELVDPASLAINLGGPGDTIDLPTVIHLESPLVGPFCRIGTDLLWSVNLSLSNGPPGNLATGFESVPYGPGPLDRYSLFKGERRVDQSFSVPPAALCGYPPGILDLIIDAALGIPSPSGENEVVLNEDFAVVAQD